MGSVNFSKKDSIFLGKIEGTNRLVNFEGESVKKLTEAFHNAIMEKKQEDFRSYE